MKYTTVVYVIHYFVYVVHNCSVCSILLNVEQYELVMIYGAHAPHYIKQMANMCSKHRHVPHSIYRYHSLFFGYLSVLYLPVTNSWAVPEPFQLPQQENLTIIFSNQTCYLQILVCTWRSASSLRVLVQID